MGTAKNLIDGMIFPLNQDMTFSEVFLASFRFFMPAQTVLNSLIGWYNVDADDAKKPGSEAFVKKFRKAIRSRSIKIMIAWIRNHWLDFQEQPKLYADLQDFVEFVSNISFGTNQKLIQAIREQRLTWYTHQYVPIFWGLKSTPAIPTLVNPKVLIYEWEAEDFAVHLSFIDRLMFRQLRPDYYIKLLEKPGYNEGGNDNVALKMMLEYCSWFRAIVTYITVSVAREEILKKKTLLIKRCIKVAKVVWYNPDMQRYGESK